MFCLSEHAVFERVGRLTSDQEQYNERIVRVVLFVVREGGVAGRGRAMFRKTGRVWEKTSMNSHIPDFRGLRLDLV